MRKIKLVSWQRDFVERYLAKPKTTTLLVAKVVKGKTFTALHAAREMLKRSLLEVVVVISPQRFTQEQWSISARDIEIAVLSPVQDSRS